MIITASLKYLRIAPRKVRLVANLIKGLSVREAENQLKFLSKRSAEPILKLLKSAVSNAKHNYSVEKENLYVDNLLVDSGPVLKRWRERAMGRAYHIKKRTSHLKLFLEVKEATAVKKDSDQKQTEIIETKIQNRESKNLKTKKTGLFKKHKIKRKKQEESRSSRTVLGNIKRIFRRKSV